MQKIGSRIYSNTITSTANQEILDPTTLKSNYNFDITEAPVINVQVIFKDTTGSVTLKVNNDSNSLITLDVNTPVFDSGDYLMVYSLKIVEASKNITYVAVLP